MSVNVNWKTFIWYTCNEPRNNILVLPADLMAEATHCAVLAAGLQAEYTKSLGDNKLLDFVVWGRNTLKNLEALESGSSAGSLVGNHATDGLVENPGGCAEMEGT